jgi:prepilin-type N-terminal cleavage/methylation domain-containing protein
MSKNKNHDSKPAGATTTAIGFTLIELLVVIGIIAVLAAILLPALAAAKRSGQRAGCLNNIKEIGQGSFIYAGDFNDYFPIVDIGGKNNPPSVFDFIAGEQYAYAMVWNNSDGSLPANTHVPQQYAPYLENLGLLYGGNQVGNPLAFFCPALQPTSNFGPANYSNPTFMSTDGGQRVRSSYMYNPRITNSGLGAKFGETTANNELRKYEKTTQARLLDVFCTDYMAAQPSGTGMPFNPTYWPHYPSKGMVTGFTDGSAHFVEFNPAYFNTVVSNLVTTQSQLSDEIYDEVFFYMQNAH